MSAIGFGVVAALMIAGSLGVAMLYSFRDKFRPAPPPYVDAEDPLPEYCPPPTYVHTMERQTGAVDIMVPPPGGMAAITDLHDVSTAGAAQESVQVAVDIDGNESPSAKTHESSANGSGQGAIAVVSMTPQACFGG
ncbi:hypothetical protein HK105_202716 [Polyrhizophydium stewartii]|uniref:Secreted protein n=1 Tax=Polyrhizophydium stewartii TaxID=2732419 RepID=A0ABR4NEA2_9FUNG|nr:hypothetical protein HK105_001191 [Polyrhizophydium stewartii]